MLLELNVVEEILTLVSSYSTFHLNKFVDLEITQMTK